MPQNFVEMQMEAIQGLNDQDRKAEKQNKIIKMIHHEKHVLA